MPMDMMIFEVFLYLKIDLITSNQFLEKLKGILMKPASYSESTYNDPNHHLGIDIQHLIMITKQKSFKMPSGLTREERRAWARKNQESQKT